MVQGKLSGLGILEFSLGKIPLPGFEVTIKFLRLQRGGEGGERKRRRRKGREEGGSGEEEGGYFSNVKPSDSSSLP